MAASSDLWLQSKSPRFNQPYAHMKAFLTHPFSVMRYFCGDITHVQSFSTKPGFRKNARRPAAVGKQRAREVRQRHRGVPVEPARRCDHWGLGGWWNVEVAGSKGHLRHRELRRSASPTGRHPNRARPSEPGRGSDSGNPRHRDQRLWRHLPEPHPCVPGGRDEQGVPLEHLRASGRDALATLEYIFAVIDSYENGGELVRPHALPAIHGDPSVGEDLIR